MLTYAFNPGTGEGEVQRAGVCVGGWWWLKITLGIFQSHLLILEYSLFKTVSLMAQADLDLAVQPMLIGNF